MDDSSHGGQRPVVSQYDFAPRHSVLFIRRFVATDGLHHRPSARDLNIPKLAGIHDCNPSPWCFGLAHLLVGFADCAAWKRQYILQRKLALCNVICDFSIPESEIRLKECKRDTLIEMMEYCDRERCY